MTIAAYLALLASVTLCRAQDVELRIATLAPKGSPWFKVLKLTSARWKTISDNHVKLTIIPGPATDEAEILSRLRGNRIQGAALSSEALSEIEPGAACLLIPMMLASYEELDYVRDRITPRLEKMIEARGYIVLNWSDAGWVHIFSRTPVMRLEDLRKLRVFAWATNSNEVELWKANGFNAVPMAAGDMSFGVRTQLIDAVLITPTYALWNRSFTMARYMNDIKWSPLAAATVVSKTTWESVPLSRRASLLKAARDAASEMRISIRAMDDNAVNTMIHGIPGMKTGKLTVIHAGESERADWEKQTEAVFPKIRGKLVPAALFDEVRRMRDDYRAGKK